MSQRFNLSQATPDEAAAFWAQAAAVAKPTAARVIKNVPLVKVGEWMASRSDGKSGVKVTAEDIQFAAAADASGKLPSVVLGVSHPDKAQANGKNKAPAVGTVTGLHASEDGTTLLGDIHVGPKWLADQIDTAYPRRSADWWQPSTGGMIVHRVSLLGTDYPAVDTLDDLRAVLSDEGPDAMAGDAPVAVAAAFDVPAPTSPQGAEQPSPQGPEQIEQEEPGMSLDPKLVARSLGLPEDTPVDELTKAAEKRAADLVAEAEQTTAEASTEDTSAEEPTPTEPVAVAAGAVALDPATLAQLTADAKAGREAREAQRTGEREAAIDAAVREGKVFGNEESRTFVQASWDNNADATKAWLASIPAGTVAPVDGERGVSLEAAASGGMTADQMYEAVYGKQED